MKDKNDNLYWESEIRKCQDIINDSVDQIERYNQKIKYHMVRIEEYQKKIYELEENIVNE